MSKIFEDEYLEDEYDFVDEHMKAEADYEFAEDLGFPKKSEFGSMSRKRKAIRKERNKLRRMVLSSGYPCGAYYVDEDGHWCEKFAAVRIKRAWRKKSSGRLKKVCNRKLRRTEKLKLEAVKGNAYRKLTMFWNEYC